MCVTSVYSQNHLMIDLSSGCSTFIIISIILLEMIQPIRQASLLLLECLFVPYGIYSITKDRSCTKATFACKDEVFTAIRAL